MASTAETRLARRAGAKALASSVTAESPTASARSAGATTRLTEVVSRSIAVQPSAVTAKATAAPPTPSASPSGMPTSPRTPASARTVLLSWRRDAPRDESRPNWRVRSEMEMVKAPDMSETAATMITTASTAAICASESMMARPRSRP